MDSWGDVFRSLLKNNNLKKKVALTFTVIVILVFCAVMYSVWRTSQDIPAIEKDLNAFMISFSNGDYKQAYEHFSNKYKNEGDFETFKKSGLQMRAQYTGYKANSLELVGYTTRYYFSKPRELYYSGRFIYEDTREVAGITAVYNLENKKWRLYGVEITPPQY